MRALLQLAAATAAAAASSSQFPLPPANSATTITATSIYESTNNLTADILVVLAALLCAVVCMAGIVLMYRYSNLARDSSDNASASQQQQEDSEIRLPFPPPPKRGLKKSALKSLPKTRYDKPSDIEKQKECAICLTEFDEGEEIRKLPECGHEFHVGCVDKWLRSRSSCPSCRKILVVVPPPKRGFEKGGTRSKPVAGDGTSTFLP